MVINMKKTFLLAAVSLFLLLGGSPAGAESSSSDPIGIDKARGIDATVKSDFETTFTAFLNYFIGFLGLLVVAMFIYAGVIFVTAQGETEQIEKAKKIILWAVVGLLIVMLSFVIVSTISGVGQVID